MKSIRNTFALASDYPCRAHRLASPGPVALLERWTCQASHPGFCSRDHGNRRRKVCPARGTHRHLRSGRHTLGRASDVHPGHVLPGARARAGRKETGTQEDRAVQDRALGQSGSDREALDERSRENPRGHSHRDVGGRVQSRSEEVARHRQASAVRPALHRVDVSAHAGSPAVSARQRYKTYIVTGGGQDFVREYSEQTYGIPPEQVVGTAGVTKYGYDKDGKPFLIKEPKLLLNDNNAGKPEGIHLMIGRRPYAAFGNSTGDRQMLEYTEAGDGARLVDAGTARRRPARVCLRPCGGPAEHQSRRFHPGTLRRGEEGWLVRHQYEERLEKGLRVRAISQ